MELSNSNVKKVLIFSQKKAVLIFQETETSKEKPRTNSLYFKGQNFLTFQETESLEKLIS